MKSNRRKFLTQSSAVAAAVALPASAQAQAQAPAAAGDKPVKKVHYRNGRKPEKTPLFNSTVSFGNLVFIGDDHAKGTTIIPHQAAPDTTPAENDVPEPLKYAVPIRASGWLTSAVEPTCTAAASAPRSSASTQTRDRSAIV